ncbi:hypothetical protein A9P82_12665 [Arachidicoccus ginsenosidimutans]|uniref:RNA polymerase sigma factor n=1 Tax=Arachidicoccus sp. BS20 TaxID=1850526 RepID=UPI0007F14EDF|nr:RNA polymerase sigma-70 factor [Arachidicoccus sp. BS20]ANI90061.1 hypothetical protein A9P82_12665 [Arachidicoccus sp. BS20]
MNAYLSLSDNELVDLLKRDDKVAFTEIYNRYSEKMVTIAYVKLQSGNDAKEVVQELFIDIWNRRRNLNIRHSFYTYINGALKYKIYTFLGQQRKEQTRIQHLSTDKVSHNTEEWLSYETLRNDLEKAILELPEKCRLVFRLSREKGLSHHEIAQHLHISKKTVENHITKALNHLHGALKTIFFLLF